LAVAAQVVLYAIQLRQHPIWLVMSFQTTIDEWQIQDVAAKGVCQS